MQNILSTYNVINVLIRLISICDYINLLYRLHSSRKMIFKSRLRLHYYVTCRNWNCFVRFISLMVRIISCCCFNVPLFRLRIIIVLSLQTLSAMYHVVKPYIFLPTRYHFYEDTLAIRGAFSSRIQKYFMILTTLSLLMFPR